MLQVKLVKDRMEQTDCDFFLDVRQLQFRLSSFSKILCRTGTICVYLIMGEGMCAILVYSSHD